jgi:hypothetical protein
MRVETLCGAIDRAVAGIATNTHSEWERVCGDLVDEVDLDALAVSWQAAANAVHHGLCRRDDPRLLSALRSEAAAWTKLDAEIAKRPDLVFFTSVVLRDQIAHTQWNSWFRIMQVLEPARWREVAPRLEAARVKSGKIGVRGVLAV